MRAFANAREVVIETMSRAGREEVAKVAPDAVAWFVSQRVGGRGIHGEDDPIEIVRADQTETVLDEMAITLLVAVERFVSS